MKRLQWVFATTLLLLGLGSGDALALACSANGDCPQGQTCFLLRADPSAQAVGTCIPARTLTAPDGTTVRPRVVLPSQGATLCSRSQDCPPDHRCINGRCYEPGTPPGPLNQNVLPGVPGMDRPGLPGQQGTPSPMR